MNNSADLLEIYNPHTGQFEKPTHWLNGKKVVIGIGCDDIQSSNLIGSKKLKNMCIKIRHYGAFESGESPIGASLFICVQNYTASGNEEIPRCAVRL